MSDDEINNQSNENSSDGESCLDVFTEFLPYYEVSELSSASDDDFEAIQVTRKIKSNINRIPTKEHMNDDSISPVGQNNTIYGQELEKKVDILTQRVDKMQ